MFVTCIKRSSNIKSDSEQQLIYRLNLWIKVIKSNYIWFNLIIYTTVQIQLKFHNNLIKISSSHFFFPTGMEKLANSDVE